MTTYTSEDFPYLSPMERPQAGMTVRDRLCSNCWGALKMDFAPDREYWVYCPACGKDTRGYTHKARVERRRMEDHFNAIEVRKAYPDLDPNYKPLNETAEESIKKLGF